MSPPKTILFFLIWASSLASYAQMFPEMIKVEGGSFVMGDRQGIGRENEQPTHVVNLKGFKIGVKEVTVAQYRAFCKATRHPMPEVPDWVVEEEQPIVNVSWQDAVMYCQWLSERQGGRYRLPTEAEWEYAARGGRIGSSSLFSGGEDLDSVAWYGNHTVYQAQLVGQKKPNQLGLYDMSGNVWEWCADWYGKDYYAQSPESNPLGPSTGDYRVMRGGSWHDAPMGSRNAYRNALSPEFRFDHVGFRVVKDLE